MSFNLLTSVSGVGPKVAISILSILSPDRLAGAVCTEDVKAISKAPGVGSKTAARIVLELKDKLAKDMISGRTETKSAGAIKAPHARGNLSEAAEALMALGYDRGTVVDSLKGLDPATDVGLLIKAALKKLAGR